MYNHMYMYVPSAYMCVVIHSGSVRYARCYRFALIPAKEGVVVGTECH